MKYLSSHNAQVVSVFNIRFVAGPIKGSNGPWRRIGPWCRYYNMVTLNYICSIFCCKFLINIETKIYFIIKGWEETIMPRIVWHYARKLSPLECWMSQSNWIANAFANFWLSNGTSLPNMTIICQKLISYHPYQLKLQISRDVQGLHWFRWCKIVIPWLSTCT